jgi:S1-C subfamily serine protease
MPVMMAILLLLLAACARLPGDAAHGTPAAAAAQSSFAVLTAHGLPIGSAVAVAPDRLLTNAHVVPADTQTLRFTRGDGAASGPATVIARSAVMDLLVLQVPPGIMQPAPIQATSPASGERLWALGAPSVGPTIVAGLAEMPRVHLPGHGPGFTARLGALMGYSGGPVLDQEGRLRGLVTALPRANAAPLLAALTGVDLHGLAQGAAGREVFVLSIAEAMAEAAAIAP